MIHIGGCIGSGLYAGVVRRRWDQAEAAADAAGLQASPRWREKSWSTFTAAVARRT